MQTDLQAELRLYGYLHELYNLTMEISQSPLRNLIRQVVAIIPGVIFGLFVGRIISELIQPDLLGAISITLISVLIASVGASKLSFAVTWPALLLFLYVLYPEADPEVVFSTILLFLLAAVLAIWPEKKWSHKKQRYVLIATGLLLGAFFLTVFYLTISTDILPADSGEFQLVATELGIAHPPGFPLYTMLAHLMTRLPFGKSPAFMVNLFSVLLAVATLLVVYYAVFDLTSSYVAGIAAAIALGATTTFWAQATGANIRMMTALFAALMMLLTILIRKKSQEAKAESQNSNEREPKIFRTLLTYTLLLAAVFTLGITHHPSLAFLALVILPFIVTVIPKELRTARTFGLVIVVVLLSLLPLLYLPFRASVNAIGTPEDLLTPAGFINHVLALGFRGDLFFVKDIASLWERLKIMANVATFQFPLILNVAIICGLIFALWRERWLGLILTISITLYGIVAASYRAPQTVEYLMPTYVLSAIAIGYLVGQLRHIPASLPEQHIQKRGGIAISAIIIGIILVSGFQIFGERLPSFSYLHEDTSTRNYAQPLLDEAPPDAIILADWHWATPLWYLQQVEGQRPDVEINFVFPTSEPYADTWARRIAEELDKSRPVVATHFNEAAYTSLPKPEPLQDAFVFSNEPRREIPANYAPLTLNLSPEIELLGYYIESASWEPGSETVLTLAWDSNGELNEPTNLYAHLVSSDGMLFAQDDVPADPQPEGITLNQFRLTPLLTAPAGEYELIVGSYTQNSNTAETGQSNTVISSINMSPLSNAPATTNPAFRPLAVSDDASTLVGYDWDNTLPGHKRLYLHWQNDQGYRIEALEMMDEAYALPAWIGPWGQTMEGTTLEIVADTYYVPHGQGIIWTGPIRQTNQSPQPGEVLEISEQFISSQPILSDQTVSLRLVGYEEDGFHWAWWDLEDGTPALGAIPTLKWITDSKIDDPRHPTISETAYPGQVIEPLLRLYDAFTGRPLPILDERLSSQAPWIPLGKITIPE